MTAGRRDGLRHAGRSDDRSRPAVMCRAVRAEQQSGLMYATESSLSAQMVNRARELAVSDDTRAISPTNGAATADDGRQLDVSLQMGRVSSRVTGRAGPWAFLRPGHRQLLQWVVWPTPAALSGAQVARLTSSVPTRRGGCTGRAAARVTRAVPAGPGNCPLRSARVPQRPSHAWLPPCRNGRRRRRCFHEWPFRGSACPSGLFFRLTGPTRPA